MAMRYLRAQRIAQYPPHRVSPDRRSASPAPCEQSRLARIVAEVQADLHPLSRTSPELRLAALAVHRCLAGRNMFLTVGMETV